MTNGKREKPLGLDMSFKEALERLAGVSPEEMPDNVKLSAKARRRKKGDGEPPPPSDVEGDGD